MISVETDRGPYSTAVNVQKKKCPKENVQKKLSERQLLIMQMIQSENLTLDEMSKRLNVAVKTIQRDLDKLKADGYIERVGGRTYGEWKIK